MDTPLRTDAFICEALDSWGSAVYRLALSQTRSAADAQDVAQEVFIRLLKSTVPFESDEHLKAWLLHVTINCCRDLQRSAWHARVESLDESIEVGHGSDAAPRAEVPSEDPTPEDETVAALSRNPVWDALKFLSPDQQLAVHLRYVEECDETQIARIMGVQPATVRTRLHRARKRLRELLEAHESTRGTSDAQDAADHPTDGLSPYAARPPNTADTSNVITLTLHQTSDDI